MHKNWEKPQEMDRSALLRRIGNISQLACMRRVILEDGTASGCKAIEVANGGGLDFTVLEGKGLNILNFGYKGTNLSFIAKPGLASPAYFNPHDQEFPRNFQGGMLFTCGLLNVGPASVDQGLELSQHGRIGQLPAEQTAVSADWESNDYVMRISGDVREAALFRENLVLKRTITTKFGSKALTIHDTVENQGFEPQPLMILYHMNIGYPLLDTTARLLCPDRHAWPFNEAAKKDMANMTHFSDPVDDCPEQLFCHKVFSDAKGWSEIGLINEPLDIGLAIRYNTATLPNLLQWKSMRSGDYALGIEPTNSSLNTRAVERANGTLRTLAPMEKVEFDVELTVLEGQADIRACAARIEALAKA